MERWIHSEGAEADHAAGAARAPLIGAAGSEFVAFQLGFHDPGDAIREIQRRCSIPDER